MADPSCPIHPDERDFYLYEGKKPRCKSCVRDGRKASRQRKAAAAAGEAPPAGKKPKPVRAAQARPDPRPVPARAIPASGWHWSWGPPPGGWKGPPSTSPDAWGPYKGITDDELRFRKSRRGLTGYSFGYAWLSPKEWEEGERKMKEKAEEWARKHSR